MDTKYKRRLPTPTLLTTIYLSLYRYLYLSLSRGEDGWEELEKTPYSNPPELPDVMKPGQDSASQADA